MVLSWRYSRQWWAARLHFLLPALMALGQIVFLRGYLPAPLNNYSGWDVHIPLQDFQAAPALCRRVLFWLMVDGEFIVLGIGGLLLAWSLRRREENRAFFKQPIIPLFVMSIAFFVFVNSYRYSRNWGDSNKFVLFMNFWLAVILGQQVVVLGKERWIGKSITGFILALSLVPHLYDSFAVRLLRFGPATLFSKSETLAALWIKQNTKPDDVFVNTTFEAKNFVSALAGREVLLGMYKMAQPYYDPRVDDGIKALYTRGDFSVVRNYGVSYIIVSAREKADYKLNSIFDRPAGLAFLAESYGEPSVRIYSTEKLMQNLSPAPPALLNSK